MLVTNSQSSRLKNRWKINIFSIPKKYSIRTCARHSLPSMEHRWWPKMEREYKELGEKKNRLPRSGPPPEINTFECGNLSIPPPMGGSSLHFYKKWKAHRHFEASFLMFVEYSMERFLFWERVKGFWGWRFLQIILAAVKCDDIQSGCENNQLFKYPVLAWLSLKQRKLACTLSSVQQQKTAVKSTTKVERRHLGCNYVLSPCS